MNNFSVWHWGVVLVLYPLFGLLYSLPTIIAISRRARNCLAVALVNAGLGFTLIGWIVALVMALVSERAGLPEPTA